MNILITPLYTKAPTEYVISLIPTLLLPFNFAKTLLNGAAALVIYKPLVRAMRAARLAPPSKSEPSEKPANPSRRPTVMALIVAAVAVAVAVTVFILISTLTEYHFDVVLK